MKVAILSESGADEAALRVLIEGLLGRPVEAPFRRYLIHDAMEGGPALRADSLYNRALEEVAERRQVLLMETGRILGGDPAYYIDFCHFSAAGNRRIAEVLADVMLREHLCGE